MLQSSTDISSSTSMKNMLIIKPFNFMIITFNFTNLNYLIFNENFLINLVDSETLTNIELPDVLVNLRVYKY